MVSIQILIKAKPNAGLLELMFWWELLCRALRREMLHGEPQPPLNVRRMGRGSQK